jgi:hypothetical protein
LNVHKKRSSHCSFPLFRRLVFSLLYADAVAMQAQGVQALNRFDRFTAMRHFNKGKAIKGLNTLRLHGHGIRVKQDEDKPEE